MVKLTDAEKEVQRFYRLTGEGIREAIIVTPDLEIRYGFGVEHRPLAEKAGFNEEHPRLLRASYFPQNNVLWFTWPNRPSDIRESGVFGDHFSVLYDHLSRRYQKFGMRTKVDWAAGVTRQKMLGEEISPRRRPRPDLLQHRPVRVRQYRRQA